MVASLREALQAIDRAAAASALERFEAWRGSDGAPVSGRARHISLDALLAMLRRAGRRVEVHLAADCEACEGELGTVRALEASLPEGVSLVILGWDALDAPADADARLGRLSAMLGEAGIDAGVVVPQAASDHFFNALGIAHPRIPQTRVVDADGGLLRVIHGPLDEDAVVGLHKVW